MADTATAVASLSSIATTTTVPSLLLRGGRNVGGDLFLPKPTVAIIAPRDRIRTNKRDADDEAEHSLTIVARILEDGDESNEEAEDDESNEDEDEEDDEQQQSQEDENDDDNDDDDAAAAGGGGGNYYYYDDAYMNNGGDNAGSSSSTGSSSSSSNIDNSFIQIVLSDLRERFDSDMSQFWELSPSQWDANMREDCFIMVGIVLAGMILPCIICVCCYCFCCRRRDGEDVGELPYLLSQTTGGSATDYTDCDDDGTETDYSGISKNYTTDFTNFTTKSWENPFVLLKDFSRSKTITNKTDTIRTKDEEMAANTTTNNNNSRPIITTTAGQTRPTGRRKNELTLDGDGLLSTYNPVLCDNLSPMSSNSSDDIQKTRSITATQYSF